ncbi:MAG: hypothetical protein ACTSYD_00120 [Candidatus Heimdallarchaeaceae archaeon]
MEAENKKVGTIKDELTEILFLKKPKILVFEWLPFDSNQLKELTRKLDIEKGTKRTIVTAMIDKDPDSPVVLTDGKYTKVQLKDYKEDNYINIIADIELPEEESIVQIEQLAVYISVAGFVVYSLELDEVESSNSFMSLDKIARITADIFQDTSIVIDSLLTEFQRNIIKIIYGNPINRPKARCFLSTDIRERFENIMDYYDGEDNEIELSQMIGEGHVPLQHGRDLYFKGPSGLIAVVEDYDLSKETAIVFWGIQESLNIFIDSYLARIWELFDNTKETQLLIQNAIAGDTEALTQVENEITELTNNVSILHQVHSFLLDSVDEIIVMLKKQKSLLSETTLTDFLKIETSLYTSLKRVRETEKILKGIDAQIEGLRNYANTLSEVQMRKLSKTMAQNTKSMSQMIHANNRTSEAIDVIELILAGSIILEIVAFAVGEISADSTFFAKFLPHGAVSSATLFFITLIAWIVVVILLRRSKKKMEVKALKDYIISIAVNKKINIFKLEEYIKSRDVTTKIIEEDRSNKIITYEWNAEQDPIFNHLDIERVQLSYNASTSLLINIEVETSRLDINDFMLKDVLLSDMNKHGVFEEPPQSSFSTKRSTFL